MGQARAGLWFRPALLLEALASFSSCSAWEKLLQAMGPLRQATGPPQSGAGVRVGMLRESRRVPMCFIDTPGGPYVRYWHSGGAICAFLTLLGDPICFIDQNSHIYISCFLIDMKFIFMIWEIIFNQFSLSSQNLTKNLIFTKSNKHEILEWKEKRHMH